MKGSVNHNKDWGICILATGVLAVEAFGVPREFRTISFAEDCVHYSHVTGTLTIIFKLSLWKDSFRLSSISGESKSLECST